MKIHESERKIKLKLHSRIFFVAITELFIESGNVYIETKRNVDPYIAFYASLRGRMTIKSGLISTNPDSPAIRPRRDASQKLYKDPRFFSCTRCLIQ